MVTNNSINVGTAASNTILQGQGAGVAPAFSTATYPATTTVSQLLYSSATNTVSGLATANRAVITTGSTGVPVATALATDGQLIIGSTAGAPAAATLTAGTGVTITNASNSITIAASGGGSGSIVGQARSSSLTPVSTATNLNLTTTTPTTGNTALIQSVNYTPTNSNNIIYVEWSGSFLNGVNSTNIGLFLFAGNTLINSWGQGNTSTTQPQATTIRGYIVAGTTSSTTYALYAAATSSTTYFQQTTGSVQFYNGTAGMFITVTEVVV